MPRYDYQCERCTEIFEVSHPMTGPRHVNCPVCKTGEVHRIMLTAPAVFIWWKSVKSSPTGDSDGMKPNFMGAVKNRKFAETDADFGGK